MLIAIPVALYGWLWWGDRSLEARLRPIAAGVAGHSVSVECQGFLANLVDVQWREGEVRFDAQGVPEPKLFLARSTCGRLRAFAGSHTHAELACLRAVDWAAAD
ncbi:MAG: hypothetical protein ACXWZP_08195, partial [Gaiellaceae bacterium]